MDLSVVMFLYPFGEGAIEAFQTGKIEVADQELIADGSEEALHLAFGGTVPDGRMVKEASDPGADLDDLLRCIDRAVIDIEGLRNAAFVEGGTQRGYGDVLWKYMLSNCIC
jgi:hypothetical protein